MFLDLQIKTDQGWQKTILPPDASISIEDINPLFDTEAGGAFSYPFTISVEANQHLFPTVTNHHGAQVYNLIYHKSFRLSAGGYPLLYGIIDLDEEVEIAEKEDGTHTVAINLASNNQELSTRLEGVNAQDIPLKDRIPVGTEFREFTLNVHVAPQNEAAYDMHIQIPIPPNIFALNQYKQNAGVVSLNGEGSWVNSTNIQDPYPQKAYCNARVAVQKKEEQSDGNYTTLREYDVFDADRPNSGICFYVLYFLDCLFAYKKKPSDSTIQFDNSALTAFEDFCRLAFFSTKCECDSISTATYYSESDFTSLFDGIVEITKPDTFPAGTLTYANTANAHVKYANSKNFPDVEALSIIENLQKAFGIRFLYDSSNNKCRAIYVKDVFRDKSSVVSGAIVHSAQHVDYNVKGVKMSYGGGEDDTNYNYSPKKDTSPVIFQSDYDKIRSKSKDPYNRNTYYNPTTGNFYRVKVDEEAKNEDELHPSLFEVGQFADAWVGDVANKDLIKDINLDFTPVTCNDVRTSDSKTESNQMAVFIDADITEEKTIKLTTALVDETLVKERSAGPGSSGRVFDVGRYLSNTFVYLSYKGRYGFASSYVEGFNKYEESFLRTSHTSKPIPLYEEDPLATYNAGFMLGIMRGPGNEAGVEVIENDYDGNGNSRWAYVADNYAFTSDSIDHYAHQYDYNGTAQGGVDQSGRVSLKLQAEKVALYVGKQVDETTVQVSTTDEAAFWLGVLFPDSHQDLLKLQMKAKAQVAAAGWSTSGMGDYVAVLPYLLDYDDEFILVNLMMENGAIMTPSQIQQFKDVAESRGEIFDYPHIIIKRNAAQKDVSDLNGLANIYYKIESANNYTIQDAPTSSTTDFYPIDSTNAHRGLLHKFNYEYFWFLIHARLITLVLTMELDELLHLDKTCWHTFGQYTGLIKNISYKLSENGLSQIKIGLYYL